MNIKKWIALMLCVVCVFSMTACKSRNKEPDDLVQTLPTIETAVQKEYTPEQIIEMYNNAWNKIADSESYHMHGSYNSTSVFGDILTSVVTTYDMAYQSVDGKASSFFDSKQTTGDRDYSHTTYHDGERYYYFMNDGLKYYTDSNDYNDYSALDYLMPIGDVELQDLDVMDQLDGSVTVSFTLPMGEYMSTGILDVIGFNSETFEQDPIHLSFSFDREGVMTYFYISYTSYQIFLDEQTEQTVIVSMTLDGYDTTTVEVPADLDAYESFIEEGGGDEHEHEGVGILSPEDVD